MDFIISIPTDENMTLIGRHIKDFILDDEDLQKEKFLIAINKNRLIGFGRLRNHKDAIELCSLGVIPEFRSQGVGKKIVNELIKKASSDLYVVCIIPDFFRKFGFNIVTQYPESMKRKHQMCTSQFVVEEPYCVMRLI